MSPAALNEVCQVLVGTYMVPPALAEVWKLVLEGVLEDFEHNTDHHAQPPVAQHQRL